MIKAYIAFSASEGTSEGAILVLAENAKQAKKLAWGHCLNVDEWIDQSVRLIRTPIILALANADKLKNNIPHVVESPCYCINCELWGAGITQDKLCSYCNEHPGDKLLELMESYGSTTC